MSHTDLSRRLFLQLAAGAPLALGAVASAAAAPGANTAAPRKAVPIGLEMFTLRAEEERDRMGTLRAVKEMGYDGVEFYGIYFDWTPAYAREVRAQLDALGLRCFSTHTRRANFAAADLPKVTELNQILGSRYAIMAHSETVEGEDGWKRLAETLTRAHETLRPLGLSAGFHNYPSDFRPIGATRPIDILAASTPKDFLFQLDTVGPLIVGADPAAFVTANPGRVRSYHLTDWKPGEGGGRVLLGEGVGQWKALFDAAEGVGGVEYYLVEQEGSRFTPVDTARRSLELLRALRAA
jgi:sugar phosphate isomerase/epimerase